MGEIDFDHEVIVDSVAEVTTVPIECPGCGGQFREQLTDDLSGTTCHECNDWIQYVRRSEVRDSGEESTDNTEQTKLVTDGGQDLKIPAEKRLSGETEVTFQCGVAANNQFSPSDPEWCSHEPETIELDEPASVDENNRIHVPGRPVECPECGQPVEFEFNGVRVMFA